MTVLTQQHETILVVDDEPSICRLVKTLLEREGYAVFIAGDAETASKIYEEHSAEVALLLTDMRMPGTNGVELADRILRCTPQMRVLFMSGSDAASRGFGCLAKPFTRAQLISRVNQALGGRTPAKLLVAAHAA
jgi:two-component system, cell cycle sensor histidine kinase and response regulator CckA